MKDNISKSIKPIFSMLIIISAFISFDGNADADEAICGVFNSSGNGWVWLGPIDSKNKSVIYKGNKHLEIKCNACHHTNRLKCNVCHKDDALKSAYHKLCIGCHKRNDNGNIRCGDCHDDKKGRGITIDNDGNYTLGAYKKTKGAVRFTHKKHESYVRVCRTCHHKEISGDEVGCITCHDDITKGKVIEIKEAYHKLCRDCHKAEHKGPTRCDECHQKKLHIL